MRVLHIIDHAGLGGAQAIVKGIFENQKNNENIFLYVLRNTKINIAVNHKNVLTCNSKLRYSIKPLKELKKIIKDHEINILHCHLFRSQVTGWILKKYYFPDLKLIFHEHGQIFENHRYYNILMRKFASNVDLFIAVSNATKNKLIEVAKVSERKIIGLYNFIDLERFNRKKIKIDVPKEKDILKINKDEFVIGFVGRLSKVKGCEYLIRALPNLDFKYKAIVVGEGPLKKELESLATRLEVKNNIIFLGYIPKIEYVYPLFDVLTIPSISESFGLSAVEAQAMQLPVIASNVNGLNEVIINNHNGLLFKSKDSSDLAEVIKKLRTDKKLRKGLIKNLLVKLDKYNIRTYLTGLDHLYKNV